VPDDEHANARTGRDRPMTQRQPSLPLTGHADDLYAKLDGQVIRRRGESWRLDIFGIVYDQGKWWIQFALAGTEPYQGTICVSACDLDWRFPQIDWHTTFSRLDIERTDGTPMDAESSAEIEQRLRAQDILNLIRDQVPLPDRRHRKDRRAVRRGGRRDTD
jgi:hypothetical protein